MTPEDNGLGRTTLFAIVPEWVLNTCSPMAVVVYAYLDRHANSDGDAFPSQRRLSGLARVSVDTVKRAVRELEETGALVREKRARADGGTSSNLYRLVRDLHPPQGIHARGGSAHVPGAVTTEPEKGNESGLTPKGEGTTHAPPKLVLVDGRNLAFDALAEVCGIDPSGNRAREIATALNGKRGLIGIRALAWRDLLATNPTASEMEPAVYERFLARVIGEQAQRYRASMRNALLTPLALAKWWTDLGSAIGGSMTPEQIAAYGREQA